MQGPETRQSLLIRLRDPAQHRAWSEFVEIYEPLIYRVAIKRGLQHADAQDMTQEVFSAVSNAIGKFETNPCKGSFRGWLNRITCNLVINFLTRQKQTRGTGDSRLNLLLQAHPSREASDTAKLIGVEYQREVFRWAARRIQDQFSESTWRAFWLTAVEEKSIEFVANQLDKSVGAIRIARCRVLNRLKEEVKRYETNQ